MRVDLHCHSTASDGALSPAAIVARAAAMGVELLALTDHDTVSGIAEARATAEIRNVRLLGGVEISAIWEGHEVHVIGIGVDEHDKNLIMALAEQQNRRWERGIEIAHRLEDLGIEGAWGGSRKRAGDAAPGRAHFAKFLLETGGARSIQAAFDRLLGAGRPAYVAPKWMSLEAAVRCIAGTRGRAVVAHPERYDLTGKQLARLLDDFSALGGWGLEAVARSERHVDREVDKLCRSAGLPSIWGSDFHQPGIGRELGVDVTDSNWREASLSEFE